MTEPNDEGRAGLGVRAHAVARSFGFSDDVQPAIHRQIGDQLRRMYMGMLDQKLPGRLLVLLSQMARQRGETNHER